jgi:hypothetical protein
MKDVILIMDDNEERLTIMRSSLTNSYPDYQIKTFDNAPDTIEWLRSNIDSLILMSLDHDLGPNRERKGQVFDPGIGKDVVDFLVSQTPVCPVVIHSSNYIGRDSMIFDLEGANWKVSFVSPYGDLEWIHELWKPEMDKYFQKAI